MGGWPVGHAARLGAPRVLEPVHPNVLDAFLPAVSAWFCARFGVPTPPQRLGWPEIAAGRHTLILAPTGSGKTLAAFLAALDHLWRVPRTAPGARILYVSPLKALNEDIERNLQEPLAGILETAVASGTTLERLSTGVRTGDTPPAVRQRLVRRPPDILITTPESLHLMLTCRARQTLRHVSHVIVDEIHALAPNKRGVFLALLLERLQAIQAGGREFVRIGLSATQRPLEEVARYLGGRRCVAPGRFEPRPVTIVDTGVRKELDLEVSFPAAPFPPPVAGEPQRSVWPAIEARLLELIGAHRSTIVFTNNRRVAERLTARLNERAGEAVDGPVATAAGTPAPVRSHHGSLSLPQRRETETALKRGELPAVVATASLELGIDMGAVELVCQVESPGSVARGLQRVGRAGHLDGVASKGRLLAKTAADLLESAALARAMRAADVEAVRVPLNCLDVLAQQVIACVAMDAWDVPALFDLMRQADPYRELTAAAFEGVLQLASGRYALEAFRDLHPRVSWDRVHNRLNALPGTARLALVGGGTIPDTGQYPVYLGDGGPRLGELDEEFVLERRVGEAFLLGTSTWRIDAIEPHRVLVAPAQGHQALVPFWRGESCQRTAQLGQAVGSLCRETAARGGDPARGDWLCREYGLDAPSARLLGAYVDRQVRLAGVVPDDRTLLVETFRDPAGERGLAVLTPFGGKFHHALKLVLQAVLRRRLGITVAALHGNDGILCRLPGADEPPAGLLAGLDPDSAAALLREELGSSALFGLRFRQNAGRALLLPRPDPGRRTPLWLQRLRAKDLLQAVRQVPDFPIVVETYRECLDDDLDLPQLRRVLEGIADGSIRVAERHGEIASPFGAALQLAFTAKYLYEWDEPRSPAPAVGTTEISDDLLAGLLDPRSAGAALDPDAIGRVDGRLRESGRPPRSVEEMADRLRRLGDLAASEVFGPMAGFLEELAAAGRAQRYRLDRAREPDRWISAEDAALYAEAFAGGSERPGPALGAVVHRYLQTRVLVGLDDLAARYGLDPATATELLEGWAHGGRLVRLEPDETGALRWADRRNLQEARRLTIALRRSEAVAVAPEVFADFLLRRHHLHPETIREGAGGLADVLERLQGFPATAAQWETELLPRRLRGYRAAWLDEALAAGGWSWRAGQAGRGDAPLVALAPRGFEGHWPVPAEPPDPEPQAEAVLAALERRGAQFVDELARSSGLEPLAVRTALEHLAAAGQVANDRLDPLRAGGRATAEALAHAVHHGRGRPSPARRRPRASLRPEGRWFRREDPAADGASLLAWAAVLLDRHGVLCRETAALDPWAPPWRELYPALDASELRGEVCRGYFVEGLSGIQYAWSETAEALARHPAAAARDATPVLVHAQDPACLYGAGAPFDIPLLEGGTARLVRGPAAWIVQAAGRPVLIVEAAGRRLTGLPTAADDELRGAVKLLPTLAGPARRVLKVETYNLAPALASPAAPWLAEAGFVRDHPGMAYYAGWS